MTLGTFGIILFMVWCCGASAALSEHLEKAKEASD